MDSRINLTDFFQSGWEINIKPGCGLIPITDGTTDVIAFVEQRYIITAGGIVLTEEDFRGITNLNSYSPNTPTSAKARRLQEALLLPLEAPYLGADER